MNKKIPTLTREWFDELKMILEKFMAELDDVEEFILYAKDLYNDISVDIKTPEDMKVYFNMIYHNLVHKYLSKRDAYFPSRLMQGYKEINDMLFRIIGFDLLNEISMGILKLPCGVFMEDRDADCIVYFEGCEWVKFEGGEFFYLNKGIPKELTYEEFEAAKQSALPRNVKLVF